MSRLLQAFLALALAAASAAAAADIMDTCTLDLSGEWRLESSPVDGRTHRLSATLPGDNYTALFRAGIIPDPYYGRNEQSVQMYRKCEWTFSRSFQVSDALLARRHVCLVARSVDTFCTIRINGAVAAECRNQFACRRVDVKALLRPGENRIELVMHPVEQEAARLAERLTQRYPMTGNSKVPNLNLVRKPHCSGGWDWGITLMTCGVYEPLILLGYDGARLDAVYADQVVSDGKAQVTAVAELFAPEACRQTVRFVFDGRTLLREVELQPGRNRVDCRFDVDNPRLWWPAGYGAQPLYELTVATEDQVLSRKIGLRTLEVVNRRDEWGLSMTFRVNGVDLFCKGADWIPVDAFPSRQTPEVYRNLLLSARDANMNMIRVWGGGQYERDCFYELCDSLGLLVWQDMMFSCSIYPCEPEFVENVADELRYQMTRLRSHPCLAMWCGDNEMMNATGWYGAKNRKKWLDVFLKLNAELARIAAECDPTRTFWPSSPCGGPGNLKDGFRNDSEGDMHYWEVWHGSRDFTAYYAVKPRFCSEFGFQSLPSMECVRRFCPEDELNLFSMTMDHHQKCPRTNTPILAMFNRHFLMPETFGGILYLSQLQQAIAVKTGVEYWRTLKPRCMGTLFWQLNDNWPVASWSSIEHGGHWKQLQYHAKRFYAPVIATVVPDPHGGTAAVWAVSDVNSPGKIDVTLQVRDFDGRICREIPVHAELEPLQAKQILLFTREQLDSFRGFFLHLESRFTSDEKRTPLCHTNDFFPDKYKALPLRKPGITAEVVRQEENLAITLRTDKPAFFVMIQTPGIRGRFDDNSITLLPGEPRTLRFFPDDKNPVTPSRLEKALVIEHLQGTVPSRVPGGTLPQ